MVKAGIIRILVLLIISIPVTFGQYEKKPKLVVGIVVDQMKQDYITRFWSKFSDGGFKKLVNEGFSCVNTQYNYIPTSTGPGHASIFTGATPMIHGIAGNYWMEQPAHRIGYCAEDPDANPVGGTNDNGKRSPKNLKVNTVGDMLKASNGGRSKVFGIAIKDRGGILSAGRGADMAFWYDEFSDNWITSDYYTDKLPEWAVNFNNLKLPEKYLSEKWETFFPVEQYTECSPDDVSWERPFSGEEKAVFPYDIPAIKKNYKGSELLEAIPAGNNLTAEFAKALISGENLGKDDYTDMVVVSFSSPDYIGHQFGPRSVEVADNYVRLDRVLGDFISWLDKEFGKDNYLIMLSSDHGVGDAPGFYHDMRIDCGSPSQKELSKELNNHLKKVFPLPAGEKREYVINIQNLQIYFNDSLLADQKIVKSEIENAVKEFLSFNEDVFRVFTVDELQNGAIVHDPILKRFYLGYHYKRGGDMFIAYNSAVLYDTPKGAGHYSPYAYDTHVPLLFYGFGIKPGKYSGLVEITDIASTLCTLMGIQFPTGNIGNPVKAVLGY